jgi:Cu/Ag efflux protein CusF
MKRICALSLFLLPALWLGACGTPKPAAGPLHKYRIQGQILKTDPATQTATIKHKAIEGWMGAMTMDYPIRTKEDFARLHVGDRIDGTVYVQDEDYSVGDVRAAPPGPPAQKK